MRRRSSPTLRWLGLDWDEGARISGARTRLNRQSGTPRELPGGGRSAFSPRAGPIAASAATSALRRCAPRRTPTGARRRYEPRLPRARRRRGRAADRRRGAGGDPLRGPEGRGRRRHLIRGPMAFHSDALGDFIMVRSDGMAGYNFAAAVDDAAMRVTHVNPRRRPHDQHGAAAAPSCVPWHARRAAAAVRAHSLILGAEGGKLSKRHGAAAVGDLPRAGLPPRGVVNYLALLSWSHGEDEVLALPRLIEEFELAQLVVRARPCSTLDKLRMARAPVDHGDRRRRARAPGGRATAGRHRAGGRPRRWRRRSSRPCTPTARSASTPPRCSSGRGSRRRTSPAVAAGGGASGRLPAGCVPPPPRPPVS